MEDWGENKDGVAGAEVLRASMRLADRVESGVPSIAEQRKGAELQHGLHQ